MDHGKCIVAAQVAIMVTAGSPADAAGLGTVEARRFSARDFRLQGGAVLPELELVYETYGVLGRDGANAILVAHGYTSSQHAAGRDAAGEPGWWDGLIGPGKTIDTNKYYVVSSNMLGSSFGSTAPASINSATGKPYGPDFPPFTMVDIVRAQHAMLEAFGVRRLAAVAGPSYGGYQAFQWGVTYPEEVRGIVAVVTAPKAVNGGRMVAEMRDRLATAPGWNSGRYYGSTTMQPFMTELRVATLKRYGIEAELAARYPDPAAREAAIRALAENWASVFDPNSLIALAQARAHFDAEKDFARMRAKVLYVLSRTDQLFAPAIAPAVMTKLRAAGVDATYVEIDSDKGHLASGLDWAKWAPALRDFLQRL